MGDWNFMKKKIRAVVLLRIVIAMFLFNSFSNAEIMKYAHKTKSGANDENTEHHQCDLCIFKMNH